ncbi:hypothetical protein CVT24_002697 [Panaeolus cyanescens]|uniref:Uncharacterized protein n=1 Tax=Panaeolus cyanescens TaxID=181874 RepID=A0A409YY76_9AGAR|nr:hypothetical protein CVT24_002697 [Panaeolus cyanescens]
MMHYTRIHDSLFSNMSLPTLLTFAKVSKNARQLVHSYIAKTHNIGKQLEDFFTPIEASMFQILQQSNGLIISGSFALRFFSGQDFGPDSDLDIYVEDRYQSRIFDWICSIGYVCTKRTEEYQEQNDAALRLGQQFQHILLRGRDGIARPNVRGVRANQRPNIWRMGPNVRRNNGAMGANRHPNNRGIGPNLRAVINLERGGRKIQLIVTHGSPIGIILEYHSTCVMNIITHDHAYCLYPKATLLQKRSLVIYRPGLEEGHSEDALGKYRSRGWTMVKSPPREDASSRWSPFPIGERHVGDDLCWTIPLSSSPATGDNVIEANSWGLRQSVVRLGRFVHEYAPLKLEALRFAYVSNARCKRQATILFGRKRSYKEETVSFKDNNLRNMVKCLFR